jgi:hypothetical protein
MNLLFHTNRFFDRQFRNFEMLAAPERQTKDITLLSGVHGRDRRAERKISKHDLQAAIKYGVKTRGKPSHQGFLTWKYTFANIVYITDDTSKIEITSWLLPTDIEPIPLELQCIQGKLST